MKLLCFVILYRHPVLVIEIDNGTIPNSRLLIIIHFNSMFRFRLLLSVHFVNMGVNRCPCFIVTLHSYTTVIPDYS